MWHIISLWETQDLVSDKILSHLGITLEYNFQELSGSWINSYTELKTLLSKYISNLFLFSNTVLRTRIQGIILLL